MNSVIPSQPFHTESSDSNCRDKANYSLQSKHLTPNIVYHADVTNKKNSKKRVYQGTSKISIKIDMAITLKKETMRGTVRQLNYHNMHKD